MMLHCRCAADTYRADDLSVHLEGKPSVHTAIDDVADRPG
jgi:hypothetical protein